MTKAAKVAPVVTTTVGFKTLSDLITGTRAEKTGAKTTAVREVLDGVVAKGEQISKAEIIKLVKAKLPAETKVYHSEINRVIKSYGKPEVK